MPSTRQQASPSEIHEILLGIGRALARQAARIDDAAEQKQLAAGACHTKPSPKPAEAR